MDFAVWIHAEIRSGSCCTVTVSFKIISTTQPDAVSIVFLISACDVSSLNACVTCVGAGFQEKIYLSSNARAAAILLTLYMLYHIIYIDIFYIFLDAIDFYERVCRIDIV